MNRFAPLEDEDLYSYISRIAFANGFETVDDFFKASADVSASSRKGYDLFEYLKYIPQALNLDAESFLELVSKTSALNYICAFLTSASQGTLVNNIFGNGELFKTIRKHAVYTYSNNSLRSCPKCRQADIEEHGFFWFRRAHQLPGVSMCHEHGVSLEEYKGERGHEFFEDAWQRIEIENASAEREYAKFANAFAYESFDINASQLKLYIKNLIILYNAYGSERKTEIFEKNAKSKGIESIIGILDIPKILIHDLNDKRISLDPKEALQIMLLLGVDDVKKIYFVEDDSESEDIKFLNDHDIEIVGLYHTHFPTILKCRKCGQVFISNLPALKSGWGCPHCDGLLPDKERIQKMLDVVATGYRINALPANWTKEMQLYHEKCGQTFEISPLYFFSYGKRCKCEQQQLPTDIQRMLDEFGDYTLISYDSESNRATIRCDTCNREFNVLLSAFLESGICPECGLKIKRKEIPIVLAQKMISLVNDYAGEDYVFEGFVNNKVIAVKHKVCGKITYYLLENFFTGSRCRCTQIRHDKISLGTYIKDRSRGRYEIEKINLKGEIYIREGDKVIGPFAQQFVLQEFSRPSPSDVFPMNVDETVEIIGASQSEQLYRKLKDLDVDEFSAQELSDIGYGFRSQIHEQLKALENKHRVVRTASGRYRIRNKRTS